MKMHPQLEQSSLQIPLSCCGLNIYTELLKSNNNGKLSMSCCWVQICESEQWLYWSLESNHRDTTFFSLWLLSTGFNVYIFIFLCPLARLCVVYVGKEVASSRGDLKKLVAYAENETNSKLFYLKYI